MRLIWRLDSVDTDLSIIIFVYFEEFNERLEMAGSISLLLLTSFKYSIHNNETYAYLE